MSNYLDSGEEIKLKTKEGYDFVFRINNIKNIGGSTVCYEAERIYSKEKGFLKAVDIGLHNKKAFHFL